MTNSITDKEKRWILGAIILSLGMGLLVPEIKNYLMRFNIPPIALGIGIVVTGLYFFKYKK